MKGLIQHLPTCTFWICSESLPDLCNKMWMKKNKCHGQCCIQGCLFAGEPTEHTPTVHVRISWAHLGSCQSVCSALAAEETAGPIKVITFLGINLESERMKWCLPGDKLHNPKGLVIQKLEAGKGVVKAVAIALLTDHLNLGEKYI